MGQELANTPEYRGTMDRLEAVKRTSGTGADFWMAREVHTLLGYPVFDKFLPVIERARDALRGDGIEPSHHIAQTSKLMGAGKGAQREGVDFFLSRAACYLVAMNGNPGKPEIAAAQRYFASRTRQAEEADAAAEDAKRLELREKVGESFRVVSGVAHDAGVANHRQALFHDARYQGLYGMSHKEVRAMKGLAEKDILFDRAGTLELSAHDFQMQAAANAIRRENVRGEARVIAKNKEVATKVRNVMKDSGAQLPEHLTLVDPIKNVRQRLRQQAKLSKA